ncbi:penicillin-binding protein activator [Chitinimonas naiadis]
MHGKAPFRWLPLFAAALLYLGVSQAASAEETLTPDEQNVPHIALILPTKAKNLAAAAEVVRQGALAAEEKLGDDQTPKLRLYATGDRDEEAMLAYREAAARGAVGVIGPLTRGAIAKLAAYGKLEIPVLALNSLEEQKTPPANLYGLGLSIETEARQAAQVMQRDGRKQPVVIEADGVLPRRMREAFATEWKRVTGAAPTVIVLANDKDAVWKIKDSVAALNADAVFLATDLKKARLIRPYLGSERPIYATSQVWGGKFGKTAGANIDLMGVKFVDMPWLLEPYQADVVAFKRAERSLGPDMERLYALGIDAYRLSLLLLVSAPGAAIEMQGVTGVLKLSETRSFSRELMSGEVGGQPRTPAPKPEPAAPVAPAAEPATPPADTPLPGN